MAMAGSLHVRSDVERLYAKRIQGGRGLISSSDIYTSRTVSLVAHINRKEGTNELLVGRTPSGSHRLKQCNFPEMRVYVYVYIL